MDAKTVMPTSGGRPIDREALLDAFLDRLEARLDALRAGYFDLGGWAERQATTGRRVTLEAGDGPAGEPVLALGVDAASGGLMVEDAGAGERLVHAGEVVRVRLAAVPHPRPADSAGGV